MSLRRDLKFQSLDEVLVELSTLDRANITTTGKWSFYQILTHLADTLEYSISQYPRTMPFLIRRTIGPMALRHLLTTGEMKAGGPNPIAPKKREEGNEKTAMLRLRTGIAAFRAHDGSLAEHPFFGRINKEDFEALHAHHAALHLSFAHPDTDRPQSIQAPATRKQAAKRSSAQSTASRKVAKKAAKKTASKKAAKRKN